MGSEPSAPRLGAFDLGCVVFGGIVGVGIFFTPAKVARAVDSVEQVIVAWTLGGVMAVLGALVFADLARRLPEHGGTFVYLRAAFGARLAFLYGWANWLAIQAGALGVIGLILVDYLDKALHGRATLGPDLRVALAALAILAFTAVNLLGLRAGKRMQNTLTIAKGAAICGVIALALLSGAADPAPAPAGREPRGLALALASAMLPVLFACGGWQQGSFVAGAARRPRRDVPLGILGGVAAVVVCYLTINLSFLHVLGFEGARASTTIAEDAARQGLARFGLGDLAGRLLSAMVVVSALGILNTICLAPPFVLHAMAKEGLFFAAVGRLGRKGTPTLGVLVQGVWGVVLLLAVWAFAREGALDALDFLLQGVVFVDWLFYGLSGLALLRLRRRAGGGAGVLDAVALAFALGALLVTAGAVWAAPWPSLSGLALCALGLLGHAALRRPGKPCSPQLSSSP